jgi:hypothetical protein
MAVYPLIHGTLPAASRKKQFQYRQSLQEPLLNENEKIQTTDNEVFTRKPRIHSTLQPWIRGLRFPWIKSATKLFALGFLADFSTCIKL